MPTLTMMGEPFLPGKIVCVGRNYVEHIRELNNDMPDALVIFNKPASCISDALISHQDEPIHYEGELCFLIQENQLKGVAFGLDLTKRELQSELKNKGLPWERAKAFDGAATFSPFVAISGDLAGLRFTLHIDDALIQEGDLGLMMVPPIKAVEDIASFMRFKDNDILMTGTPKGVGVVNKGSRFVGRVYHNNSLIIEHEWTAQ